MKKNNIYKIIFLFVFSSFLTSCKSHKDALSGSNAGDQSKGLSDKDLVQFKFLFFNATKERILQNYDLAETYFSQALKIDPNSAASMYELSGIYSFQNNKNQALFYSKKATLIEPKNIWYQLQYATCLKDNKQFEDVAHVYEKLVKDNPGNYDFYYELANSYLVINKPSEAIKIYDKIESNIGITEEASMQKLKIYKKLNNIDKAVEEAKALIKTFPKEGKYYGILGELYQDKGMNDKAFQAYNDLLTVDPTNAYVHLSLADYYRNQKQNEKAFQEIKAAFQSKELDIDTKVKILLSYYSITETYSELKGDADELCKIIVAVHPDEAKAFSIYGDFLFRDKKYEEAREQYRKAIALDKEKFALWNQLLVIESELNDYVSMEKESKEAMELFPNQAIPYFFSGVSNLQLKNYQAAVDALTEGKEFVFDDKLLLAEFYENIGDAQNQLKNHDESDAAYDKSLELNPANVSVLNNYAYYLS
ncbi:MAG: tetratricopeptide repeat protein, partial [Bacteroidia bacterium]